MNTKSMIQYFTPELRTHPVIVDFCKKYGHYKFACGRNRLTIILPGKRNVIKLPRNGDGITDNDWEGSISNSVESYNHPDHIQYPRRRLVYKQNVPVLFMEYVEHTTHAEADRYLGTKKGDYNWTWSVDCGQVGFTRCGRLVAYDYGLR